MSNLKTIISAIVIIVSILGLSNILVYAGQIESENIEYSGTITMKWKVDKLIMDWYRFEIDNDTILDVDNEYTWYKYNEGDTYTWIEKGYIFPNWWVLW